MPKTIIENVEMKFLVQDRRFSLASQDEETQRTTLIYYRPCNFLSLQYRLFKNIHMNSLLRRGK